MLFWNIILTVVIAPVFWAFRQMFAEVKRLQILLNKTREDYATKSELRDDMRQVMEALHRLEDKLDKALSSKKVDPISAMAIAGTAFNALKKGVSIGRDIESMGKDLSRWMSAVSDVDRAHHEAKNPPIFKKLFSGASVEQEAIELFTQKKQLENQRDELRKLISSMCGPTAWQELITMEKDIRQQRKETIYKQREARKHFMEIVAIILLVIVLCGFGFFILYLFTRKGF